MKPFFDIKENLTVHLKKDGVGSIPLDDLEFMRRQACRYCPDTSAEFADVSFGGSGLMSGHTGRLARGRTCSVQRPGVF